MNLLIFDMDGVLVNPQGYHQALKETVRMAGVSTGIGDVELTDEQIAQFEALGISSEWHSSAVCHAFLTLLSFERLEKESKSSLPIQLDLGVLFEEIANLPVELPPKDRCYHAIGKLATTMGVLGNAGPQICRRK